MNTPKEQTSSSPVASWADLSKRLGLSRNEKRTIRPADNKLFEALYDAYCRYTNFPDSFVQVCKNGDEERFFGARKRLFEWYVDKYGSGYGNIRLKPGGKGIKRAVTFKNMQSDQKQAERLRDNWLNEYHFDRLYERRAFERYLPTCATDDFPQNSQAFCDFILHTAVAFFLTPKELEDVLKYYGFQALHVRNIHHLAIYAVLQDVKDYPREDLRYCNPFEMVADLYESACDILNGLTTTEAVDVLPEDLKETKQIRSHLEGMQNLKEHYSQIIFGNREVFSMRHEKILHDYHCLHSVYTNLGDCDPLYYGRSAEEFSLWSFLTKFCTNGRVRQQLSSIVRNRKQPTRELMILYWMYAYCFTFIHGVRMKNSSFRCIIEKMEKTDPNWSNVLESLVCRERTEEKTPEEDSFVTFNTNGFLEAFLSGQPTKTEALKDQSVTGTKNTFDGSQMVAFINDKLSNRYEWGMLNKKRSFDRYLTALQGLKITAEEDEDEIRIKEIDWPNAEKKWRPRASITAVPPNVPFPLFVIVELLNSIVDNENSEQSLVDQDQDTWYPLACSLFDLS